MFRWRVMGRCLLLAALAGCQRAAGPPPAETDVQREMPGLHNIVSVSDRLLSGSSPEGEPGFRSLRALGVRTVISVDGAKPEVDLARQYELRYVHLPIGYDGVPREQALRIAKAVRELPGLVYIHCHHGKHRGPAAAAAAQLCLDEACTVDAAIAILRRAGADPRYRGLYDSVEHIRRPTSEEWDRVPVDFPEAAPVSALAEQMVAIDRRWDDLKAIRAARWRTPPGHADLDPAHEALQLREQFREASRSAAAARRTPEIMRWLDEAEQAANDLEVSLRAKSVDPEQAKSHFGRLSSLCQQCHERFRDRPSIAR